MSGQCRQTLSIVRSTCCSIDSSKSPDKSWGRFATYVGHYGVTRQQIRYTANDATRSQFFVPHFCLHHELLHYRGSELSSRCTTVSLADSCKQDSSVRFAMLPRVWRASQTSKGVGVCPLPATSVGCITVAISASSSAIIEDIVVMPPSNAPPLLLLLLLRLIPVEGRRCLL